MDRRGGIVTVTTEDRPRVRPPIDPRIRERRIEVIREAGRRRLRVTLVVTSTIVALGLVYLGVHSPLLNVDHVRVTGAHQETTAAIVRAAGVHKGAALLFVDTGRIAGRVEVLPWVQHARVTRDLPGTIRIKITEYAPGVFVRVGANHVALAASTGRVIALAHAAPKDAIEVIGEKGTPTVGTMLSPPAVAQVPAALPGRLRAQVRAIDMTRAGGTLLLRGRGEVRLGGLTEIRAKGIAALAVLDHLAGQPFTYIDVAAPQAPVSR
jgi:cell division septal protein FtsQ